MKQAAQKTSAPGILSLNRWSNRYTLIALLFAILLLFFLTLLVFRIEQRELNLANIYLLFSSDPLMQVMDIILILALMFVLLFARFAGLKQDRSEQLLLEEKKLRQAYEKFYPRKLLSFMGKKSATEIEGEQFKNRNAILFSISISNFAMGNFAPGRAVSPAEKNSAKQDDAAAFHLLQGFAAYISPVAAGGGGSIQKLTGNHLLAIFPGQPEKAFEIGRQFLAAIEEFNRNRFRKGYLPVAVGIGMHYGQISIATLRNAENIEAKNGEMEERLFAAVTGNSIHLTEQLTKLGALFGVPLLSSKSLLSHLPSEERKYIREIATVKVGEIRQLITIYEYFRGYSQKRRRDILSICRDYKEALRRFRAGEYHRSENLFKDCLKKYPDDLPSQKMLTHVNRKNLSKKILALQKKNYTV